MTTQNATDTVLADYQLRLPSFEGPLDVLLRLIERSELAITDVSLMAVAEQFLAYLATLDEAPAESVAEFAAVGSRLVLLKSRSLLPRPTLPDIDDNPDDLVRQLVEYRAFKQVSLLLAERDARGSTAFQSAGIVAAPVPPTPPKLAAYGVASLTRALRRRFSVTAQAPGVLPLKPVVTLRTMIERVLTALAVRNPCSFRSLLAPDDDRRDALTAFLAVLVLVRRQAVEAHQATRFGEISLVATSAAPTARPATTEYQAADD